VTVKSGFYGLDHDDVFYFGNLVGEVDGLVSPGGVFTVDSSDEALVTAASGATGVGVDEPCDINRDGNVDNNDLSIIQAHSGTTLLRLEPDPPAEDPDDPINTVHVHGFDRQRPEDPADRRDDVTVLGHRDLGREISLAV